MSLSCRALAKPSVHRVARRSFAFAPGGASSIWSTCQQLEQKRPLVVVAGCAKSCCVYDLIVIDELGYLPFSQPGGQLLFHLISKLYETLRC